MAHCENCKTLRISRSSRTRLRNGFSFGAFVFSRAFFSLPRSRRRRPGCQAHTGKRIIFNLSSLIPSCRTQFQLRSNRPRRATSGGSVRARGRRRRYSSVQTRNARAERHGNDVNEVTTRISTQLGNEKQKVTQVFLIFFHPPRSSNLIVGFNYNLLFISKSIENEEITLFQKIKKNIFIHLPTDCYQNN